MIDSLDQLFDRAERASTDRFVGDQRKEAFDLVEPRTVGGNEMHMSARACRQPCLDLRMLVTAVVVDDAVHIEFGRHGLVDFTQERQEFPISMTALAGSEHDAIDDIQGGKQRRGAMTDVIVSDAFNVAETHRQYGSGALERLTLALFVHAQHQGVLRWTQVQADHIAQFLDEELIGRELETFASVRLQTQQFEVTVHARRRDGGFDGNRAHTPVSGSIYRLCVQGLVNQLGQSLVVDGTRLAGTYFIVESVDSLLQKPQTSLAYRGTRELQALRDRKSTLIVRSSRRTYSLGGRKEAICCAQEPQRGNYHWRSAMAGWITRWLLYTRRIKTRISQLLHRSQDIIMRRWEGHYPQPEMKPRIPTRQRFRY